VLLLFEKICSGGLACRLAFFDKRRKIPEFVTCVFTGKGIMKQTWSGAVHTLKEFILVDI
jgi:hypothetical protein